MLQVEPGIILSQFPRTKFNMNGSDCLNDHGRPSELMEKIIQMIDSSSSTRNIDIEKTLPAIMQNREKYNFNNKNQPLDVY